MLLQYYGRIKSGKLIIASKQRLLTEISDMPDMDIIVSIEKKIKKRSINQLNYLWGYLYPQVREGLKEQGMKCSIIEVHELMKHKFLLQEKINENTGEVMNFTGSTRTLSTTGMMEYYDDIARWASEYLGITILMPNEQAKMNI